MTTFEKILFIAFLLCNFLRFDVNANTEGILSDSLHVDSSEMFVREPEGGFLEEYKNDLDFQYDIKSTKEPVTFWEKFLRFLDSIVRKLFDKKSSIHYIWYFVFFVLIVLIVLRFLRNDISDLFFSNKKVKNGLILSEDEKLMVQDIEKLIQSEVEKGNYKNAVRLLYLNLLKTLSESGVIKWQIDKTNREYIRELRKETYRKQFAHLARTFEYLWYGNFEIELENYKELRSKFDVLKKEI